MRASTKPHLQKRGDKWFLMAWDYGRGLHNGDIPKLRDVGFFLSFDAAVEYLKPYSAMWFEE